MSIATLISIGDKKGQVVINSFSKNHGQNKTETRHIKRGRDGHFRDKFGNSYEYQTGMPPTAANTMVFIVPPPESKQGRSGQRW